MILSYIMSSCLKAFAPGFKTKYKRLLEALPLSRYEKDIVKQRYLSIVIRAEIDYRRTCILYIILTNTITISGVLITGFVSLNKMDIISDTAANVFFWIVWVLSIILTLSNKWL